MSTAINLDHVPAQFHELVGQLAQVSKELSYLIQRGPLAGKLGDAVGTNTDGDSQKALDVQADEAFAAALARASVRYLASEERDTVTTLDPEGKFAVAIDPLDGSSNIDVNVSIGTIFSVFHVGETPDGSFLRSGREQIAAGYVIYGPQTALVVTFGNGTQLYVCDPETDRFELVTPSVRIPSASTEFAINASNYRHWFPAIRAYIDDCIAGQDGPRGRNYNMRWVASLVAETHRIVSRGGIFLYPGDAREGYKQGRLRHVYECAPIAFLVEQAEGRATNGIDDILDLVPTELHQRTPFVFGTPEKVGQVTTYHDLPDEEVSALFGSRGLFRA